MTRSHPAAHTAPNNHSRVTTAFCLVWSRDNIILHRCIWEQINTFFYTSIPSQVKYTILWHWEGTSNLSRLMFRPVKSIIAVISDIAGRLFAVSCLRQFSYCKNTCHTLWVIGPKGDMLNLRRMWQITFLDLVTEDNVITSKRLHKCVQNHGLCRKVSSREKPEQSFWWKPMQTLWWSTQLW